MKRIILILCILLSPLSAFAQNQFEQQIEQAKELLETIDSSSLYQSTIKNLSDLPNRGVAKSYTDEALIAGWGTSRWDLPGSYYPGMDLEKHRATNRKAYLLNILKIAGISAGTLCCICLVGYIISRRRKRNKKSSKELLIYFRKEHPHSYNTES